MLPVSFFSTTRTVAEVLGPTLKTTFKLAQIPYFFGVGVKEIFYDNKRQSFDSVRKADCIGQKIFEGLKIYAKQIFNYEVVHGFLMLSCGACEVLATIHRLGITSIALQTLSTLSYVSMGCFSLANFIMVCEQVRILLSVLNIPQDASQEVKDAVRSVKISAIIALLSGLCYLVGLAIAAFGGPVAAIVLFMLLGLLGGGSKILYDMIISDEINTLNQYKILINK